MHNKHTMLISQRFWPAPFDTDLTMERPTTSSLTLQHRNEPPKHVIVHTPRSGPLGLRLHQSFNKLHVLLHDLLPHHVGDPARSLLLGQQVQDKLAVLPYGVPVLAGVCPRLAQSLFAAAQAQVMRPLRLLMLVARRLLQVPG